MDVSNWQEAIHAFGLECIEFSMQWHIGDRVQRHIDVFDQKSPLLIGTVINIYAETKRNCFYPELYEVEWDDGDRQGGFLRHGLQAYTGKWPQ